MTIVVTIAVAGRFRGFLASVMLEIAAGVYIAPAMTAGVRDRVWGVLAQWHADLDNDGVIVMAYPDRDMPGDHGLRFLGEPPKDVVDADGVYLVRRSLGA